MPTHVAFHLLPENEQSAITPAHLHFICLTVVNLYRQRRKVFVLAEDQAQAHIIDEHLWQFEPDSFVAHHLSGELPIGGSPIEIGWCDNPEQGKIPPQFILVNASSVIPKDAQQQRQIIEFVPSDDDLKIQARERFKHYRQLGMKLTTQPWSA